VLFDKNYLKVFGRHFVDRNQHAVGRK